MPVFKVNPKFAKLTEVTNGLYVCGVSDLNPETLQNL
uniref:Uncharacterized protein n=1 Tax=Romanomermis culicivorax TaxID=13658 RepID=A0A915KQM6_ROMCU